MIGYFYLLNVWGGGGGEEGRGKGDRKKKKSILLFMLGPTTTIKKLDIQKKVWPTKKKLYLGRFWNGLRKRFKIYGFIEHMIKINWNPNIKANFFLYLGTPVQLSDGQTAVSGVLLMNS